MRRIVFLFLGLAIVTGVGAAWGDETGPLPVVPPPPSEGVLKIINFAVGTGEATLFVFPTGKNMLFDSGDANCKHGNPSNLINFLDRHGITHLDYYAETHPHHTECERNGQLDSLIDSKTVRWDYKSNPIGSSMEIEGTNWFFYNGYDLKLNAIVSPWTEEKYDSDVSNYNSISARVEYNGFVYSFSGDEGPPSQIRFLNNHPKLVRAHMRLTAHHSWTPVHKPFFMKMDPVFVVVSNGVDIRKWGDDPGWTQLISMTNELKAENKRFQGFVVTDEVGNIFTTIKGANDWDYEFCKNWQTCVVDHLK